METEKSIKFSQKSKSIIETFDSQTKQFYEFHGIQLLGSQFPITLIDILFKKLKGQVYDGGNYFQVLDNIDEQTYQVHAKNHIKKQSNVFIIDHTLTFRYPDLRRLLKQNQKVVPRVLNILKYSQEYKELPWKNQIENKQGVSEASTSDPNEIQFDSMGLTELGHLQFPPNTVTLSLIDNQLSNEEQIIKKLNYLNLKALWINNNPVSESETFLKYITQKTKIEIYNSKLTQHCTQWGLKFCLNRSNHQAITITNDKVFKLNLDSRNVYSIDVNLFKKFKNLRVLSLKSHQITTQHHRKFFVEIFKLQSLTNIYVDYQAQLVLHQMYSQKLIGSRIMVNSHSFQIGPPSQLQAQSDRIHNSIFRLAGCYRLANTQKLDETSIWYLNDELGSAVTHSDRPNVRIIPFLYSSDNKLGDNMQAFSLMWPIEDIASDGLVERDYLHGLPEAKQRSSRLSIWYKLPKAFYSQAFIQYDKRMSEASKSFPKILQEFYKNNAIKQKQQINQLSQSQQLYPQSHSLLTNDQLIIKYLKDKRVQFVDTLNKATIIWISQQLSEEQQWKQYKGKFYVNQFPYQSCVVNKKNLAETVQSVFGDTAFLMRTYDLQTQLPQFLGDYYNREQLGNDNLWIIKPPNMARSMDMVITNSLPLIVKEMETGPKIVQKYISNPVLRRGKKVDLRFVLAIKSILPLTMFLYKHFWIRSSNNPYTIDSRTLATYQTQFTVMNYGQKTQFQQIPYADFIKQFESDYKTQWSTIHQKIKKMLRNVFIGCAKKHPQMQNSKSRAVYGVDIMIDSLTMQPKLLQLTFAPDCKRACQYYPTFYDEIFDTLFFDGGGQNMERII